MSGTRERRASQRYRPTRWRSSWDAFVHRALAARIAATERWNAVCCAARVRPPCRRWAVVKVQRRLDEPGADEGATASAESLRYDRGPCNRNGRSVGRTQAGHGLGRRCMLATIAWRQCHRDLSLSRIERVSERARW